MSATARRTTSLATLLALALSGLAAAEPKRVAITIDDLPGEQDLGATEILDVTRELLRALRAHDAPAIGFVTGSNVLVRSQVDHRLHLLELWLDAGMMLGNHTFSHLPLSETSLAEFELDIVQGELLLRHVQRERGQRLRYFRAPQNQIGPTAMLKDGLASFLRTRRQRLAPFTVEHADYAFDRVYVGAIEGGDFDLAARTRAAYLEHLDVVFSFFESLSAEMFDRQIAQVFLIHANRLNAATLDEMLQKLEDRGYVFVSLPEALDDDAYDMPDHFIGPVGISWLHRWSFSRGFGSRRTASGLNLPETLYREPDPPAFVLEAMR